MTMKTNKLFKTMFIWKKENKSQIKDTNRKKEDYQLLIHKVIFHFLEKKLNMGEKLLANILLRKKLKNILQLDKVKEILQLNIKITDKVT